MSLNSSDCSKVIFRPSRDLFHQVQPCQSGLSTLTSWYYRACCCSCSCCSRRPWKAAPRMTRSPSSWRGSAWWCVTPRLRRSPLGALWACPSAPAQDGWPSRPAGRPTMSPQTWATAPWSSTLIMWVALKYSLRRHLLQATKLYLFIKIWSVY